MALGGKNKKPEDALETLCVQDELIRGMLDKWEEAEGRFDESREENVKQRWVAGSSVKLLVQHLAVREEAARHVRRRLEAVGQSELATRLEGNGEYRRRLIRELDKLVRFHEAITLNTPQIQQTVLSIDGVARTAIDDDGQLVARIEGVLGPAGSRGLPSDLSVRLRSTTYPVLRGRWWENIGPLRALAAFYAHLRLSPKGILSPRLDKSREHLPGPGR